MAKWTSSKPSHLDTWFSLLRLGQIKDPFPVAGQIKMSELTFYNPTIGNDSLKVEATLIADTIDRVFTAWKAKLERNISRNTALNDMIKTLLDKDKTILDLAEINDGNYFFDKEIKTNL